MKKELETRTKRFALTVIQLVGKLPRSKASDVIGYQLLQARNNYEKQELLAIFVASDRTAKSRR